MTDEREDAAPSGDGGDGLDAWLAANFPPLDDAAPKSVSERESASESAQWPQPGQEPEPVEQPEQSQQPQPAPPPETSRIPDAQLPPPALDSALSGVPDPVPLEAQTEVFGALEEPSVLDDIFGAEKFREYEAGPDPSESPFATKTVTLTAQGTPAPLPPREGLSKVQKILLWVGGSLVAVLALVTLFLIGTKLPALLGPAPAIVVPASSTPTPTPTAVAIGPVKPGDYRWDKLLGGECLNPYSGPWAEKFTVVDCTAPHPAQLTVRGIFPATAPVVPTPAASDPATPSTSPPISASGYPGVEALQAQINLLCTAPTVINYAAAGQYTDIQFEASFPATDQQWADGDREYFCFVSRASGEPITGSIAVPPAAPVPPEPTPAP